MKQIKISPIRQILLAHELLPGVSRLVQISCTQDTIPLVYLLIIKYRHVVLQIVDRPTQSHVFLSRQYVQPQWIFDCVNILRVIPTDDYIVGRYVSQVMYHMYMLIHMTSLKYAHSCCRSYESGLCVMCLKSLSKLITQLIDGFVCSIIKIVMCVI